MERGYELGPVLSVTFGYAALWMNPSRKNIFVFHWNQASHCLLTCWLSPDTTGQNKQAIHQWRVEPALSDYFLASSRHEYFYLLDNAAVWTCELVKGDECVSVRGTNNRHWVTWEQHVWLLSDGTELSTLHQSPHCECCLSGWPALTRWWKCPGPIPAWAIKMRYFPTLLSVVWRLHQSKPILLITVLILILFSFLYALFAGELCSVCVWKLSRCFCNSGNINITSYSSARPSPPQHFYHPPFWLRDFFE